MIGLLRKIRRTLVGSGNIRNYLPYAIGEIVLVVVGILIALQINNWNINRSDRAKERIILVSLQEDFSGNQRQIDSLTENYHTELQTLEKLISYTGQNYYRQNSLDTLALVFVGENYHYLEIVDGTLNSILTTDKLELIQNESLKKLLSSYPGMVSKFRIRESDYVQAVINAYRPQIEKYIALISVLNQNGKYDRNLMESDYEGFLTDRQTQNTLLNRFFTTSQVQEPAEELKKLNRRIVHLLEEEIRTRFSVSE